MLNGIVIHYSCFPQCTPLPPCCSNHCCHPIICPRCQCPPPEEPGHAPTHTCMQTHKDTHVHVCTHACTHKRTHTQMHGRTHTKHMNENICTFAHTHTHTHTHTRSRTHAHTHTRTQAQRNSQYWQVSQGHSKNCCSRLSTTLQHISKYFLLWNCCCFIYIFILFSKSLIRFLSMAFTSDP